MLVLIGLFVAFFGPLIPLSKIFGEESPLKGGLMGQAMMWIIFSAILLIVRFGEQQPLSSIGLQAFRLRSLAWGLGLYAVFTLISFVQIPIQNYLGIGFQEGSDKLSELPTWYLVFAVITAGIVEETLYRGYGFSRVETFIGNQWMAGTIVVLIFGAAHIPMWGLGTSLGMTIAGIPAMVFFVWKRDLYALMMAHTLSDATGLIIVPRLFAKAL